jgi:hypothetical protein
MSTSKEAWDAARETDHATSIPIDVGDAAIHYKTTAHDSLQTICTIAPVCNDKLVVDGKYTVYRVKKNGAVMHHERGPLAIPVGRVQEVVDYVVENTDYVVTSINDEEYYSRDDQ